MSLVFRGIVSEFTDANFMKTESFNCDVNAINFVIDEDCKQGGFILGCKLTVFDGSHKVRVFIPYPVGSTTLSDDVIEVIDQLRLLSNEVQFFGAMVKSFSNFLLFLLF